MVTQDEIAHWRGQIFARLLLVVLLLGLVTAVPSVALAAKEQLWSIAAVDTVALLWLAGIWRLRGIAYTTRVLHFLTIVYLVGVALLLKVGPVSQIYLMAVPILAALLLGRRAAIAGLVVTAATLLLLGIYGNALMHVDGLPDYSPFKAAIIALNFMFITAVLTMSCATLLHRLDRSLGTLRAVAASLETGKNALHALNAELRLTAAAVARLNDMVLIAEVTTTPDGAPAQRIIFVNEAFEQRNGYPRDEAIGRGLRLLQGPATDPATLARIALAVARTEPVRAELLNYTKAGAPYWVETELVPFTDEGGKNTHWVAVERDITERKRSEEDIHRLAFYDPLTDLPNRRLLMDRIDKLLAGAQRGARHGAVLYIDLDHFKNINDARGHSIGDALLVRAAERLTVLMRLADTVARIGGDEFVVLLDDLAEHAEDATRTAMVVAEKIRASLAEEFEIDGQPYLCSASIGVTVLPRVGQTASDLLREADTAMYRAKAAGRNGIAFFETAMQAAVEHRLTLERDLAGALEAGQLEMHLQAQVDRTGRPVGAEMLMRWRRADGSMVPPSLFIPIAEESGLILRLGHWALEQACAAQLALADAGHHIALSVNVSPSQFRQVDYVDQVRAALAASGATPERLILEVTEGLLVDKRDDTIGRMHALAALGIRFSIDDFGTGYSSLNYLKRMPLYELKIDKSFVDDLPDDANGTAIVQTILAMARHLDLTVVAEGVETQAQADFLIANDCHSIQGYLYARPVALPALIAYLDRFLPVEPELDLAGIE